MADQQPIRRRSAWVEDQEDGIKIQVFPLAYHVMEEHIDSIALLMRTAAAIDLDKLREASISGATLWSLLAPLAGREILKMVNASCKPTLHEVYASPEIVAEAAGKWIELSFLRAGSLERILTAVESLLTTANGGEPITLRQQLRDLLRQAIDGATSSGAGGGMKHRTGDGASQSSSTISTQQTKWHVPTEPVPSGT